MDYEIRVRELHGLEHLRKQRQTLRRRQSVVVTPGSKRLAGDVLHDQVWQTVDGNARVIEARNVRVFQSREDVALLAKACGQIPPQAGDARQLEGNLALECPIGSLGEPYLRHAAAADLPSQSVRPHQRTDSKTACRLQPADC